MSDPLHFMMGEFRATFPTDRQYAQNHMWARRTGDIFQFGFTTYAVRLLQDVYFLDWAVDPGTTLEERQELGAIESKKAEASLYSPMAGELVELNQTLLRDPSAINLDNYGAAWLFTLRGDGQELLTPEQYVQHVDEVWEVTQRTIKGQMNE